MRGLSALSLLLLLGACPGDAPRAVGDGGGRPLPDGHRFDGQLGFDDQGVPGDGAVVGADTRASDGAVADSIVADGPLPDAPLPTFSDVSSSDLHYQAIVWVAQQGIMKGCGAQTFCPDDPLLRDQTAVTLVRMKYGESFSFSATPVFSDVPATHWAFKYIQRIAQDNITTGCASGLYCPSDPTLRKHAAIFLVRAKYGNSFSYTQTPHFNDVPSSDTAFKFVQKMVDENLTSGCSPSTFCPDDAITRAEWAAFLYRAQTL